MKIWEKTIWGIIYNIKQLLPLRY